MHRFIFNRLLMMIPILLGVSIIIFTILSITPGDPASFILGAGALQVDIDNLNRELGYDLPFWQRYFRYLGGLARLDFGNSYITRLPVIDFLLQRTPITLTLAFWGTLLSLAIGIPLGVISAVRQYSLWDTIPTFIAMFLAAAPNFWVGLMLMLLFSLNLGWLPTQGVSTWAGYVLPTITLGLMFGAQTMRFTRSSMLETIRQDYIRTARGKGAAERTIIWKHAMRNALMPVITVTGNNFGFLLGGAIVTETLFGIPGIGTFIVQGIRQMDTPVVMGGTIWLAMIFSLVMLTMDLLYAYVDPRIKAKYVGNRS